MRRYQAGIVLLALMCVLCACFSCGNGDTIVPPQEMVSEQDVPPSRSALRSVVSVTASFTEDGSAYATANGSAIVYKVEDGGVYLLTNYHVIYEDVVGKTVDTLCVAPYGFDPEQGVSARYLAHSAEHDLALLYSEELTTVFPAAVPPEKQGSAVVGDTVYAVGNALGRSISVTAGVVGVERETVDVYAPYKRDNITMSLIRVDCALNQGNSGGGLFSSDGHFLGMVGARQVADQKEGIGYVIPASIVWAVGDKLMHAAQTGESVSFFHLGADIAERPIKTSWSDTELCPVYECDVLLTDIDVGSVASALFEEGDVIEQLTLNDAEQIPIRRGYELSDALLGLNVGDRISVTYRRDEERHTISFTVSKQHMTKLSHQ